MNNNERVQRFDSLPLDATYFTDEGYLVDHPIVTSVGIFVYHNPDGSILLDWNETTWKHGYPAFRKDRCKELERGYCKGGPGLAHFYAELKKKYKEEQ